MSNEFWTFSLATYGAEGIAQSVLAAQDQLGLDVNVVLYASWLAAIDRRLSPGHLKQLNTCIEQWRSQVVVPLRTLRRQLREVPGVDAVRDALKSVELQAERQQQDLMWDFYCEAASLVRATRPLAENLALLTDPVMADNPTWGRLVERFDGALGG